MRWRRRVGVVRVEEKEVVKVEEEGVTVISLQGVFW